MILIHHSGVIAHEGSNGKSGDVALVESLVETYIIKPSCLILLTVTCESMCSHVVHINCILTQL
jgi:hypothetical protein